MREPGNIFVYFGVLRYPFLLGPPGCRGAKVDNLNDICVYTPEDHKRGHVRCWYVLYRPQVTKVDNLNNVMCLHAREPHVAM